jgi:hypothetical protein
MVDRLPRLYHLTPPITRTETIVTRFAPLQINPGRFGVTVRPRHHRCYDSLFSSEFLSNTGFALDNYAYYFDRNFEYEPEAEPLYWTLLRQVDNWKRQHRERIVDLSWKPVGDQILVFDSRPTEAVERLVGGTEKDVLLACAEMPVKKTLLARQLGASCDEITRCLALLDEQQLIWTEDDYIMGLAIPDAVVQQHRSRGWQQQWTALYA